MYGPLSTEFYDLNKPYASHEEIIAYKSLVKSSDLILEAMCGSGRLLIPLLQEGLLVHGVDNSADMLASCRQRAQEKSVSPIVWNADVATMQLPYQYNAIIIAFGSFQLLYPRATAYTVLHNLKRHLLPGGMLIMDLFIPWNALCALETQDYEPREVVTCKGDSISLKTSITSNRLEQFFTGKNRYEKKAQDGSVQTEEENVLVCWYYRYEIELILAHNGFSNIHVIEHAVNGEHDTTHLFVIVESN
jgi:SAM-dependent methyltransferase